MRALVIAILLLAVFCFDFKKYFKKKQESFVESPNSWLKNSSRVLSRRLLSDTELNVYHTLHKQRSDPALRQKRDYGSQARSQENQLLNSTAGSHFSQNGPSDISVDRSRDLEWKIDLHVARHKPDELKIKTVTSEQIQKSPKTLYEENMDGGVQNEGHESLGVKLTMEGQGEESDTDLLKAWDSVGMFLKSVFEENVGNDSSNQNVGIKQDEHIRTLQMKIDENLQLSRQTGINDILLTNAQKNLSVDFQSSLKSTREGEILDSLKASDEIRSSDTNQIIEDGFLEVKQNLQDKSNADNNRREGRFIFSLFGFRQTLPPDETDFGSGETPDDNTALSRISRAEDMLNEKYFDKYNETKNNEHSFLDNADLNETESIRPVKKEARFFFGMLGFGSGDDRALLSTEQSREKYEFSQTPTEEQSFDTGISALGLKSDNKDSAEVDTSERNESHFSDYYADLYNQTSQLPINEYHDLGNSTDLNETEDITSVKKARFFFNIMGFGSGEERAATEKSSEDYKISTSEDGPVNHTESFNTKFAHGNEEYLETMRDTHSVEADSDEQVGNFSNHFVDLYEQISQSSPSVEPQNNFEEEMVLQHSIEDKEIGTTELSHPTEKISPRLFGGMFSAESGDGDLISRRFAENETLTPLLPVVLSYKSAGGNSTEETSFSLNEYASLISETPSENLLTSLSETRTSVPNLGNMHLEDGKFNFPTVEHTPSERANDEQSDSAFEDFYFTEYREVSHTSEDSNTAHDSKNFSEQLLFERRAAFSSGDGDSQVTEGVVSKTSARERGARFLDDCYDADCLEFVRIHENKSDAAEVSESTPVTNLNSKNKATPLEQGNSSYAEVAENHLPLTTVAIPFEKRATHIPLQNEGIGYFSKPRDQNDGYSSSAGITIKTSEELTTPELKKDLNFTTDFPIDLSTKNIQSRPSSDATVRPNEKDCKTSRNCNEDLNERCVHNQEGSVCDCGRSFVRHPITKRCEAKTMVEASLRFPAESYHEDLEDPQSERYQNTKKAAEDMMKTLLQVNGDLASTVADVEVVGFKPGSLIIIWNLIIPVKANESLNFIMEKVDHGLNESLHNQSVLKKLPFNAMKIDILKVHQSAVDPCKFQSLNYCGENSICTRDSSAIRGFNCRCADGFADLSEDVNYPGETCRGTCIPGYCGEHGFCVITEEETIKCNCNGWFLGDKCQISGVVMVGSASTAVILVFMLICMFCLVCRYKRSSTYGSDVEQRFHRTEDYGLNRKGAKVLGDVLPMEESRAVPSGFRYVGSTPNPPQLLAPEVPKITVTSPTISDMTYDFSESTFDSMKS